jgi:hypothetical protein
VSSSPLQEAVDRVVGKKPAWDPLNPAQDKGEKPGGTSVGWPSSTQSVGGSSVFAETDYTLRQYWPERVEATSSDGLFVILGTPIKLIETEGGPATFKEPTP